MNTHYNIGEPSQ